MKKQKYIKIILITLIFFVGGFFGYKYFFDRGVKKIKIQNEIAENNNTAVSGEVKNNISKEIEQSIIEHQNKKETTVEKNAPADKLGIIDRLVSWGYEKASGRKIDTIIIHSTYNSLGGDQFSLEKILSIYKSYGVAPHYIIDRDGKIYCLVADENIAYHAGKSQMPDGRTDANNFSIGIELVNSKTEKPTDDQYAALKKLISQLKSEYKIKYILGHNQIAPIRKDDPWNFDWRKVTNKTF
jgi:hypothetical protein